ncbi:hypothetical protein JOC34_002242 [Virgibacillus halotolerans]|uniref:VOC family protein n=1 Tax=Virgibacillus halotolerans TaxID=1071053 RepID=UPI00195FCBDA|nr:VOC family protein [Virgibacillus halotolerans]MBM7599874.1 hypothetical protein [Virgibacillus halotolerans]
MLAIDHIVIVAKDPAQAAADFEQKYGVMTLEGGRHTKWGTYNYLAYFSNDCYIEWLGIFDRSLAVQSDNPLVQQTVRALEADFEGTIQFALRTENMDQYLHHFATADVAYTGPIQGSRQKPDGATLEWRMLFPNLNATIGPFMIEWGKVRNSPPSEHFLNKKQVKSVTCGLAADIIAQVYQLHIADHAVQLDNAMLILEDGEHIRFELE